MAEIIVGPGNQPGPSMFNDTIGNNLPGIITASTDQLFAMARKSSLWTLSFGLACCAIEMMSTTWPITTLTALAWLLGHRLGRQTS